MATATCRRARIHHLVELNEELSALSATALGIGDRLMAEEMDFRIALNQAEILRLQPA